MCRCALPDANLHHGRTEICGVCAKPRSYIVTVCDNIPMGTCTVVDENMRRQIEVFLAGSRPNPPSELIQYVDSRMRASPEAVLDGRSRFDAFIETIQKSEDQAKITWNGLDGLVYDTPYWQTPALLAEYRRADEEYGAAVPAHAEAFERIALRAGLLAGLRRLSIGHFEGVAIRWLRDVLKIAVTLREHELWRYSAPEPLGYEDVANAVVKLAQRMAEQGSRLMLTCLTADVSERHNVDDHASAPGSRAVRARVQDGKLVISLGEFNSVPSALETYRQRSDRLSSFEDAGLAGYDIVSGPEGGIREIQARLCAATESFQNRVTQQIHVPPAQTGQGTAESDPRHRIAALLASARGAPHITGVPGFGTAVPDLTAFVIEEGKSALAELDLGRLGLVCPDHLVVEDLRKQENVRKNPIDRPAAELLAWTLERHLETILDVAAQVAHHAGNSAKSQMRHHTHAHQHASPPGVLYAVFPKDIELARRLLGERV